MAVSFPTDEETQRAILDELKWDMRVRPNEVGVAVRNGIVTLTGWVDSYLKKLAAEDAAHRIRNVKAVVNAIEVRLPGSAERTDTDLAVAVLNTLQENTGVPADKLDVIVRQGWVTLKGEVEHYFQKSEAGCALHHVAGIRGITNLITVKSHVVPLDLRQRIEKALSRNAEIDASTALLVSPKLCSLKPTDRPIALSLTIIKLIIPGGLESQSKRN